MANTFNLGNGNWAQKTENLLAYNAENNNYKPLPFDFDRASTATRVNRDGLIETVRIDEPRIDFLNNTKGHLLLEPQRQNIITYSEDFSEWSLGQSGTGSAVVISNNAISPDGNNTADKVVLDMNGGTTSSDFSFITIGYTSSATTFTLSCYLKGVNGGEEIFFDFDNQNSNLITLTTEWVRYDFTKTVSATGTRLIRIGLRGGSTTDDTASFYAWGAQLEEGSYATSYIPTSGQSGGVTRSAETCNNAGNLNVFNDSEGVLYAEISALANDSTYRLMSISDGTAINRIVLGYSNGSNLLLVQVRSSGNNEVDFIYSISDITLYNKIALLYKSNEVTIWVNGVKGTSDTSASMPIGLSEFNFNYTNSLPLYGNVKDVRVYNTALTDAELIALTS